MGSLKVIFILLISSCAMLEPVQNKFHQKNLSKYKYILLPNTSTVTGSTAYLSGNTYSSMSNSINPMSLIEGKLLKKGVIRVDKIKNEDETLILRYGQSGRRNVAGGFGGYTLEVTIGIMEAKNQKLVYTCTAEGQGSTEADDIRVAIDRCMYDFIDRL